MSDFLSQGDYSPLIQDTTLVHVIQNTPAILNEAELMAQSEIEGYLAGRFDVATIFSAQGTARDQGVLMRMIDVTLYHLHSRVAPRNIPQIRIERYKMAIEWLRSVAYGSITPNLPIKQDEDGEAQKRLVFGSNEKFNHRY